jgi:hypothetical protein
MLDMRLKSLKVRTFVIFGAKLQLHAVSDRESEISYRRFRVVETVCWLVMTDIFHISAEGFPPLKHSDFAHA